MILNKLEKGELKNSEAAQLLCLSERHVKRLRSGYRRKPAEALAHGNRGRKPVHTLDDTTKQLIVDLYRTKYSDANITHYSELLGKYEHIKVSPSTIRATLLN